MTWKLNAGGLDASLSVMSKADSHIIEPPRLMAGAAVVFWGALSGNALAGFVIAVLLEARNWVKIRWDFGEKGHVKAYQVSLFLLLIGMVMIWMDGAGHYALLKIVQWMPLYALPVELAQRYGRQDSMYLNTFFYFSRRRMIQDRREGREVSPLEINTGYPYIGLVLLAAACATQASWTYMAGIILFTLAVFMAVGRQRGMRSLGVLYLAPLVIILSALFQWGLVRLNNYFRNPGAQNAENLEAGGGAINAQYARLGGLGKVKQSKEVMWRVWTSMTPGYLRVASYDTYWDGLWTYNYRADGFEDAVEAFEQDGSITVGDVDHLAEVYREEDQARGADLRDEQGARIRGTVENGSPTTIVPSLPGYFAVSRMFGTNVTSENNPLGTLRLINRDVIIDYMLWAETGNVVQDALPRDKDLAVDVKEAPVIKNIARDLKLHELSSARAKVTALQRFFISEFEYATHFEADYDYREKSELEIFLTEAKKGHCEYFASAAVLLLRESGVPARYTIGYAVEEKEDDVWLIRGTHGHAWCRVFLDGKWEDVDFTPPGWLDADMAQVDMSLAERFQEWLKLLREDFQIWRQDEANQGKFWMAFSGLGLLLGGWLVFRLWQSRLSIDAEGAHVYWTGDKVETPLLQLEKYARNLLGPRPIGMPYGEWMSGLYDVEGVNRAELNKAITLHQKMRFDPAAEMDEAELVSLVAKVKSALKQAPRSQ
ncbi:transglutaminase-like domain-containing protein [Rubritalea squalenifaciens]|nr:transglutaminase domain-containing protein [Rubritalea squalenifaciens]